MLLTVIVFHNMIKSLGTLPKRKGNPMYTKLLQAIYRDSDLAEKTAFMIEQKVSDYQQKKGQAGKLHWDEEDIFLITYGDQFFEEQTTNFAYI